MIRSSVPFYIPIPLAVELCVTSGWSRDPEEISAQFRWLCLLKQWRLMNTTISFLPCHLFFWPFSTAVSSIIRDGEMANPV